MGGGSSKNGGEKAIYKPGYTGALETLLTGQAIGSAVGANPALGALLDTDQGKKFLGGMGLDKDQVSSMGLDVPKVDYEGMANMIKSGKTASGQVIPQWTGPSNYQFQNQSYQPLSTSSYQYSTPSLSGVPQQAYDSAMQRDLTGQQKDLKRMGAQAGASLYGSRGFGPSSGFGRTQQSSIVRQGMSNAANTRANYGLQGAQAGYDAAKTQGAWDLQRQGMQGSENLNRDQLGESSRQFGANLNKSYQQSQADENARSSALGLQGQQGLTSMATNQIGALGTIQDQAANAAMRPYQMLSSLYGQNIGIPISPTQGKGSPFSALMNAAGMALA